MKPVILFFLCLGLSLSAQKKSQHPAPANPYAAIDRLVELKNDSLTTLPSVANYISSAFTSEYTRSRAIFYWVTRNISYAPDLMYSFKTNDNHARLVKDVFQNRVAVCSGYAALVDTLCKLVNLPSFVIMGSTRENFLPSVIGHAWNAVKIEGTWQLMDATWGSGFLRQDRFVRQRDNYFFLPDPQKLITTHLPTDPIWQLLKFPVTLYQFHSKLRATQASEWNYVDSIRVFLESDELARVKAQARRLEDFGNNSEITSNYSLYLKSREMEIYSNTLNKASKQYEKAVEEYNVYVDFKNHQFTPLKPDAEIAQIMPRILAFLDSAEVPSNRVLKQVKDPDYISTVTSNLKHMADLRQKAQEEQKFVNKYLTTKKNKRRDLFYTKVYSINGIPIR